MILFQSAMKMQGGFICRCETYCSMHISFSRNKLSIYVQYTLKQMVPLRIWMEHWSMGMQGAGRGSMGQWFRGYAYQQFEWGHWCTNTTLLYSAKVFVSLWLLSTLNYLNALLQKMWRKQNHDEIYKHHLYICFNKSNVFFLCSEYGVKA